MASIHPSRRNFTPRETVVPKEDLLHSVTVSEFYIGETRSKLTGRLDNFLPPQYRERLDRLSTYEGRGSNFAEMLFRNSLIALPEFTMSWVNEPLAIRLPSEFSALEIQVSALRYGVVTIRGEFTLTDAASKSIDKITQCSSCSLSEKADSIEAFRARIRRRATDWFQEKIPGVFSHNYLSRPPVVEAWHIRGRDTLIPILGDSQQGTLDRSISKNCTNSFYMENAPFFGGFNTHQGDHIMVLLHEDPGVMNFLEDYRRSSLLINRSVLRWSEWCVLQKYGERISDLSLEASRVSGGDNKKILEILRKQAGRTTIFDAETFCNSIIDTSSTKEASTVNIEPTYFHYSPFDTISEAEIVHRSASVVRSQLNELHDVVNASVTEWHQKLSIRLAAMFSGAALLVSILDFFKPSG